MVAFAYVGTEEQGSDFEDVLVPAVRSTKEAHATKQHVKSRAVIR